MKYITTVILTIFFMVQVIPAIQSLFTEQKSCLFSIGEEKMDEKKDTDEKKHKKDYSSLFCMRIVQYLKITATFLLAEKIDAFPCLEKFIPPPDFC